LRADNINFKVFSLPLKNLQKPQIAEAKYLYKKLYHTLICEYNKPNKKKISRNYIKNINIDMTSIFLDADACPVRKEAERIIKRHLLTLFIVSNGGIRPNHNPLIKNIIVASGPDSADLWILEHIKKDDIVVTTDLLLAKECINKESRVLRPNGQILTSNNIDNLLATRNLMSDLRASNPTFQNSTKPFSKIDRINFLNSLESELQRTLKN